MSDLQQINIGSGKGLGLNRSWAITSNNGDPVHRRIYASPGLDEFTKQLLSR